jgi:lysozyme family protein
MAANNFPSPILDFTLSWEGGKSNDRRDPGGKTNYGITQRSYDAARRERGLPPADVFRIETAERDAIYHDDYWRRIDGDRLPPGLDLCVFDDAVNAGPKAALKLYARVAGERLDAVASIHAFSELRLAFLHGLRQGALWRVFGTGWGRRVGACEAAAIKLAGLDPRTHLAHRAATLTTKARKAKHIANASAGGGLIAIGGGHASGSLSLTIALAFVFVTLAGALALAAYRQSTRAAALAAAAEAI